MSLGLNNGAIGNPESYARAAMERECGVLASTAHGRNEQINRSSFAIGQLIGSGLVDRREAENRLFSAAQENGYVAKDGAPAARASIASGLDKGEREPRVIHSNGHHVQNAAPKPTPSIKGMPLPDWTPPGPDGKPKLIGIGKGEPPRFDDDVRRHLYHRDGQPVRCKVKKTGTPQWIDFYQVRRTSDGAVGWQAKKPSSYVPAPYFGPAGSVMPFDPEHVGETLFWAEGEKDVDTIVAAGGLAFTFGGSGDVPNCGPLLQGFEVIIVGDNDVPGEKSIARKIEVARAAGIEPRIVRFRNMHEGADASDFIGQGATLDDLIKRAEAATTSTEEVASALAASQVVARPFVWRPPHTFPRRQWIYGRHLIRKFVSCTVAPGAAGKTSLVLVEAISLAIGRSLVGGHLHEGPLRVWVLNLEDPLEELERRVVAICLHYGVEPTDLEGRLFLNSGRDTEVILATTTRDGTVIAQPVVVALTETIKANGIDVVIIDPFVASHRVPENDNGAIDTVCKTIARIADETNTAWDLVHHVRKGHGPEITVEDGRGAVALLAAARSARVLNPMSKDEAERAGIEKPRGYFRMDNGKANLAPPPDKSEWYHLKGVSLDNGGPSPFDQPDYVAVVETWQWPDAMADMTVTHLRQIQKAVSEGEWRENVQTKDKWVGNVVAQVLGLDAANKGHRAKITSILGTYLTSGALKRVQKPDEKRETRTFVEVGEWAMD